jgi:uncharacterized RDD family membrane protein YckC
MKCPKCGYLGFETTDRCRHCGYDFSLSTPTVTASELPLRSQDEPEAPLADFDLDRMIGEPDPSPAPTPSGFPLRSVAEDDEEREGPVTAVGTATPTALPLFTSAPPAENDDTPLITTPRPPRPPLAVRRPTPEVARRRTPRTIRRDEDDMSLQLEPFATAEPDTAVASAERKLSAPTAHIGRRLFSALVDAALLGTINAVILYLTLAIAGISFGELRLLPPVPMIAFLLLLNGGYLIAFTAAGGQTLGKMLTHIRVTGEGGQRVDVAGAVLRAIGILLTIALLGIPYIAVFFSQHRRALHDRLAGTRVIKGA